MRSTLTRTLAGRSVILAGGSGGLGSAVAELVAESGGVPVIGCLEHEERARALAAALEARHGIIVPVVSGDVLEASVRAELIEAGARSGDLYGLVPLVGRPCRVPLEEATEADFLESTRSNLVGPILLARDFVAALGRGDASVVFISTMQAVGVFPGSTLYAAPKAALIHCARILARQWGGASRIRVNVVAPGVTRSGMAESSVRSGKYDPYIEREVIQRFGESRDIARAIGLLLEPDNYITGQVLTVDGGLTARM
jgi:3-oxoacyl-[acyl-carrier protein] reductase